MAFQILDCKKYPLHVKKPTKEDDLLLYYRFEHRATIGWNTREFMVFVDHLRMATYIEEIVGGHLEKIKDESLHAALTEYSFSRGFMEATPPTLRRIT